MVSDCEKNAWNSTFLEALKIIDLNVLWLASVLSRQKFSTWQKNMNALQFDSRNPLDQNNVEKHERLYEANQFVGIGKINISVLSDVRSGEAVEAVPPLSESSNV